MHVSILHHGQNPEPADIRRWHKCYIKALQQLFDENKSAFAAEGKAAELHLI